MTCDERTREGIERLAHGDVPATDRTALERHVASCAACRDALDDLRTIGREMHARGAVSAPPGGDWMVFMARLDRRLDEADGRPRSDDEEHPRRTQGHEEHEMVKSSASCPSLLRVLRVSVESRRRAVLALAATLVVGIALGSWWTRGRQPATPAPVAASGPSAPVVIAQQQRRTDVLLAPMGLPHARAVRPGAPPRVPGPPREPSAPPAPPPADLDLPLQALIDTGARHGLDTAPTVTVLSDLVQSAGDPALRRRALFVLAQTRDPHARAVIRSLAESGAPDVRAFAVQQLGLFGGADARQPLIEIYQSGTGDVKRQVLRSFRIRGDRGALADVARRERVGALRDEAIQQLGLLGGRRELMDLYRSGLTAPGKIVEALFAGGAREDWNRLAREIEKAAADRRKAGVDHAGQAAAPDQARRKP